MTMDAAGNVSGPDRGLVQEPMSHHQATVLEMNHSDVAHVAYAAAVGDPETVTPVATAAGCARCGAQTAVMTPVGQVVSRRFTGYEGWGDPSSSQLCSVCVWLYRHRPLRHKAYVVTRDPDALRVAPPAVLRTILGAPIEANTAVIVPLVPGRKHILPQAQWGHVSVDDTTLVWRQADASRLGALARLRDAGFSESAAAADAPKFTALQKIPRPRWQEVFDDWAIVEPWRSAKPWMEVGLRACR